MRNGVHRAAGLALVAALAGLALPASAPAAELASGYNKTMSGISQCLAGRTNVALFGFDGTYTPYAINPPGPTCGTGQLRITRLESLRVGGRTTYFNRGGGGQAQRHGHISSSDLLQQPTVETWRQNGNGRAPAVCNGTLVRSNPQVVDSALYYKRSNEVDPGETHSGAKWDNYGNPGLPSSNYHYLLWNLPRDHNNVKLDGGGIPRAVMKYGTYIRMCDVDVLWQQMFDFAGNHVGSFIWGYGRVRNDDGTVIHGWWPYAHSAWGQPWTYHVMAA